MPGLSKLKADQLRELCAENGHNPTGLTRAQMINILQNNDVMQACGVDQSSTLMNAGTGATGVELHDDDDDDDGRIDDFVFDDAEEVDVDVEQEDAELSQQSDNNLQALRMKLQIEKLRYMQMRANLQKAKLGNDQNTVHSSMDVGIKDILHLCPKMHESVELLAYFKSLEKTLVLYNVEKNEWARILPSLLNQRALKAYAALTVEDSKDYEIIKATILEAARLTPRSYLERFRTGRRLRGETQKAFVTRIKENFAYYLQAKGITTFQHLMDDMVLEQYLLTLSDAEKCFVECRKPDTAEKAAEMAQLHYETQVQKGKGNHAQFPPPAQNAPVQSDDKGRKACFICGSLAHVARFCTTRKSQTSAGRMQNRPTASMLNDQTQGPYRFNANNNAAQFNAPNCTICKRTNHMTNEHRYKCTGQKPRPTFFSAEKHNTRPSVSELTKDAKFLFPVFLNGKRIMAVRDTGSDLSFVKAEMVKPIDRQSVRETVNVRGIVGPPMKLDQFMVRLSSPHFGSNREFNAKVCMLENLPVAMLIGNRFYDENEVFDNVASLVQQQQQLRGGEQSNNETDGGAKNQSTIEFENSGTKDTAVAALKKQGDTASTDIGQRPSQQTVDRPGGRKSEWLTVDRERGRKCEQVLADRQRARPIIIDQPNEHERETLDGQTELLCDSQGSAATLISSDTQTTTFDRPTEGVLLSGSHITDRRVTNEGESLGGATLNGVHTIKIGRQHADTPGKHSEGEGATLERAWLTDVLTIQQMDGGAAASYSQVGTSPLRGSVKQDVQLQASQATDTTDKDSRLPNETSQEILDLLAIDTSDNDIVNAATKSQLIELQRTDSSLRHWLKLAERNKGGQYQIQDGLLFRIAQDTEHKNRTIRQLVVPVSLRKALIRVIHTQAHCGRDKMMALLSRRFVWPKMTQSVSQYLSACRECQLFAPQARAERQLLHPIRTLPVAFEECFFDLLEAPMSKSKSQKSILIYVCGVTKYVVLKILANKAAKTISQTLLEIWSTYGIPKILHFDQSSSNMSKLMEGLRQKLGVCSMPTSLHLHQGNGLAERTIRTVADKIKKFLLNEGHWQKYIGLLQGFLNETISQATGFSPNKLLFGRELRSLCDVIYDSWTAKQTDAGSEELHPAKVVDYLQQLQQKLKELASAAQTNVIKQQQKMKMFFDRYATYRELELGQKVLLLRPQSSHKMHAAWTGPFIVTQRLNDCEYEIDMDGNKQVYHINLLRPWNEMNEFVGLIIENTDADPFQDEIIYPTVEDDRSGQQYMHFGSHINDKQRTALKEVVKNFEDIFTTKTGCTSLMQHKIVLKSHEVPNVKQVYNTPIALQDELRAEIDSLLQNDFIEPCQSEYASGLFLIRKKNGGVRLVQNFKRINQVIADDRYPMKNAKQVLNKLAGKKYVSTFDVKNFFWAIPLLPESREILAFRCQLGQYTWKRTPQGLKSSPQVAQRLMDHILRGTHKFADGLQDDIIIFSDSFQEHIKHLAEILQRIKAAGLTLNPAKCQICREEIEVLGMQWKSGVLLPGTKKTEAILNMQIPDTKKKLQAFIGLVNWFREFIPKCSETLADLTDLLRKGVPSNISQLWTQKHQKRFDQLKETLASKPVLKAADPTKPYILRVDASNVAIAGALLQKDTQNRENAIAYYSRKLLPHETHYSVIDLEALALVASVLHFENYIYGVKTYVYSDHLPIAYLSHLETNPNPRLARWAIILNRFNLEISYMKGSMNCVADALSRVI